ncbi:hypothetical protein ACFWY9_08710 [Amycolatopsis sp. NPDC059027]|uniref:hypothetical protein n=1 Tax=Amycolatopsis sp. NPDC059027 TaxID=3346709 RepID=UPI00366C6214
MIDYRSLSLDELHTMIVAEAEQHAPLLTSAAAMWKASRVWLDSRAGLLASLRTTLGESWKDLAGTTFDSEVGKVVAVARSWTDGGITRPESGAPWATTATTDDIVRALTSLADGICNVRRYADDRVQTLPANASDKDKTDARDAVAWVMNLLTPAYHDAAAKLRAATGRSLSGVPLAAVPSSGPDGTPGPGPGPAPGVSDSGGADPNAVNPEETPGPQNAPNPNDPTKTKENSPESPLVTAKNAVDVASKLLDLAKNASGGTGNVPNPVGGTFDPADLYHPIDPAAVADSLVPQADPGLPGLASAGGGGAGGGGLGGGATGLGGLDSNPVTNPAQPPSSGGGTAGGAAVPAASGTTGGAGTGSSGAMPPMYPPQSGAGRGASGGIRPGAAEQVNAVRSRKPGSGAGVVLSGREGQGGKGRNTKETPALAKATKPKPKPKPPPAVPSEPVEVLDEELWRVGPSGTERSYRT